MNNEKIIFYLTFAKTKLNCEHSKHRKAKEEIDEIIKELKKNKT